MTVNGLVVSVLRVTVAVVLPPASEIWAAVARLTDRQVAMRVTYRKFDGEVKTRSLVFSVAAASSWSIVTLKPADPSVGTGTGMPPASLIASG